jgi:flagellar biosynthesis protein FlhF
MRLKSFNAKTMTEAMQMVRNALGDEAVIIATREEKGGGVRLTAAIEPAFELGRGGVAAEPDDWLQYDDEDEDGAIAEELTDAMLRHAVTDSVLDEIISCASVMGLEDSGVALAGALEHLYEFRPLPQKQHRKALMMVGPPGSGKTLAAAKIAARGALGGLKVGVITTDTIRAGGIEQLEAFTKLLRIDLRKASSREELAAALDRMEGMDQVVIDTAGANPFGRDDIAALAKLIGVGDIDPILVMPAGIDAEESGEIGRVFAAAGVNSLLASRVDIARRLGGLLSAAQQGQLAFTDAANTPKVADGLTPLSPRGLAKLLIPSAFRTAGNANQKPAKEKIRVRQ